MKLLNKDFFSQDLLKTSANLYHKINMMTTGITKGLTP